MFTGLVRDLGTVSAIARGADGAHIEVTTALAGELAPGDSVSVNGVCLTAVAVDGRGFVADAIEETLRRSSLGALEQGARVNVELALRVSDRLGGHVVQGHVDGVGIVRDAREEGFGRVLTIEADQALLRYVADKGSIAVEGVSLTVSAVDDDSFDVALIPETLERTTLGDAARGAGVNIEVDLLAKYVEKLLPVPR